MGEHVDQAARCRRRRRRGRARRMACQGRRPRARGHDPRRRHDRQGDGRDPLAGRRQGLWLGAEIGDTVAVGARPGRGSKVAGERGIAASDGHSRAEAPPRQAAREEPRAADRAPRTAAGNRGSGDCTAPAGPPIGRRRWRTARAEGETTARLARRAAARARGRRRSAPGAGQRPGRPHHA